MKRRDFIIASSALTATALVPKNMYGFVKTGDENVLLDAYDDNKVVRVYNNGISNYDFTDKDVYWKTIDTKVLKKMLSRSILEISGMKNDIQAWKMILAGTKNSDLSNRKVAIKVNFNNTIRDINTTLNNSPAMMATLAYSLIESGIRQENICFFDRSRPFPEEFKKEIRFKGLNNVVMLGINDGIMDSDSSIFLSDNKGYLSEGKPFDRIPVPQCLIDADYLINLHLVKIHYSGVTGALKNLVGLAESVGFYLHQEAVKNWTASNHLPDISLDPEIRKRARLNICEFIFGGHTPDTIDKYTNEQFFPGGKPGSLIMSRSPFYHDTVLYNFVRAEYITCVPVMKRFQEIGPDTWLKNSSERHSGWNYDQATFIQTNKAGRPSMEPVFSKINYVSM